MLKKFLSLLLIVPIIFLWPALSGPLLLDDSIHLNPIFNWLANPVDTYEIVFGNNSGPFGRPISILSFMLNAVTTGTQIWPLKLTNLLLHLLTGFFLAQLLYRLFNRDRAFSQYAKSASIAAASLWLILPQHISTVFYVIQRMTILATLFAVIACLLYVIARERMNDNRKHGFLILIGSGIAIVLSILSKEGGLLIPLYLLLIEWFYFQSEPKNPVPRKVAWAFRLGIIFPGILIALYFAISPGYVLAGYIDRPFSMPERALTQISVIADYFASTFFPMVRSASVFNDDFPITHQLDVHQILILLSGICLFAAAIMMRKKYPGFSAGIGIFFAGHLLESSIFSLELYFAHRNYLPSIGLVLALFGLVFGLQHSYPRIAASFKRIAPLAFVGLFLVYALVSFGRASLWSDSSALLAHTQIHHPTSARLRSELLLSAMYAKRIDMALQQADIAMQTSPVNEKRSIQLWRMLAYCYAQTPQPNAELEKLVSLPADRITLTTSTALDYVSAAAEANACPGLNRIRLGKLTSSWAINTIQPANSERVWRTHLASARLLASGGDLQAGFKQAQWAFVDSGYDYHVGILAFQLANSLEDSDSSLKILSLLEANKASYTGEQQSQLQSLRK